MATVIEMLLRLSPSNYLCIEGQVSQAVEQDFLLIQVRLASRENFRAISGLKEESCIPKSVKEDRGISAPVLTSSSVLRFPAISHR